MQKNNGFIFISNPRLTSRHPDNRLDDDIRDTQISKLEQIFNRANVENKTVLIIGKLFDRHRENDPKLLIGLFTLLSKAKNKPYCLANSDDLDGVKIIKDTSLSLVSSTGLMQVITSRGLVDIFEMDGKKIGLGASPFSGVTESDGEWIDAVEKGLWITHDPFSAESIVGIDCVINGYALKGKPLVEVGETQHIYPATISRLSSNDADTAPAFLSWTPEKGIESNAIDYISNIFSNPDQFDDYDLSLSDDNQPERSQFLDTLQEELSEQEQGIGSPQGLFKLEMLESMVDSKTPDTVKSIIQDIFERAIETVDLTDEEQDDFKSSVGL